MFGGASPRSNSARAIGWTLPGRTVRTELSTGCVTSTGGCWAKSGLAMTKRLAIRLAKCAESLDVENFDDDRKGDDEGRMVTPWRSRMVTGPEALPLLLLSPGMSKIFLVGLYD